MPAMQRLADSSALGCVRAPRVAGVAQNTRRCGIRVSCSPFSNFRSHAGSHPRRPCGLSGSKAVSRDVATHAKKKRKGGKSASDAVPQNTPPKGSMADYMFFGQMLGQSAHEIKESVQESMGLEVDEESQEYLQELGDLSDLMDAALGEPTDQQSKAMKTLQKNKEQGSKTRMQMYQAQQKAKKKRQKDKAKSSNAKLMKHKSNYTAFNKHGSSFADLGDFGSILFGDEGGEEDGLTAQRPAGPPAGSMATRPQMPQQSVPPLKAPVGPAGRSPGGPAAPSLPNRRPPPASKPPPVLAGPPKGSPAAAEERFKGPAADTDIPLSMEDLLRDWEGDGSGEGSREQTSDFSSVRLGAAPKAIRPSSRALSAELAVPDEVLERLLGEEFDALLGPPVKPVRKQQAKGEAQQVEGNSEIAAPTADSREEEAPVAVTPPPTRPARREKSIAKEPAKPASGSVTGKHRTSTQGKTAAAASTDAAREPSESLAASRPVSSTAKSHEEEAPMAVTPPPTRPARREKSFAKEPAKPAGGSVKGKQRTSTQGKTAAAASTDAAREPFESPAASRSVSPTAAVQSEQALPLPEPVKPARPLRKAKALGSKGRPRRTPTPRPVPDDVVLEMLRHRRQRQQAAAEKATSKADGGSKIEAIRPTIKRRSESG